MDKAAGETSFVEDIDAHPRPRGLQFAQPGVQIAGSQNLTAHTVQIEFIFITVIDQIKRDRAVAARTLLDGPGGDGVVERVEVGRGVAIRQITGGQQVDVVIGIATRPEEGIDILGNRVDVAL